MKVPTAGDYHFWIHANPVAATLSYQLDKGGAVVVKCARKFIFVGDYGCEKP